MKAINAIVLVCLIPLSALFAQEVKKENNLPILKRTVKIHYNINLSDKRKFERIRYITKFNQGGKKIEHASYKQHGSFLESKELFIYDKKGRLAETREFAWNLKLKKRTAYVYDAKDKVREENIYNGQGKETSRVMNIYDSEGRRVAFTVHRNGKTVSSAVFKFDQKGNCIREIVRDRVRGGYWRNFRRRYDKNGHLIAFYSDRTKTTYRYDKKGNMVLSFSGSIKTVNKYNADNRLILSTTYSRNRFQSKTSYIYNEAGKKIEVTVKSRKKKDGSMKRFRYDEKGNIIEEEREYFFLKTKKHELTHWSYDYYIDKHQKKEEGLSNKVKK